MKFAWNEIDKHITEDFDLLIVSASYEKRCLSLAKYIPSGRIKKAVIFYLNEYMDYLSFNLSNLKNTLDKKNIINDTIELFHDKPLDASDRIIEYLDEQFENYSVKSVIIDSTTFTHEMLLIMLMLFKQRYTQISVTFSYSNAKDYDPQKDETNRSSNKWLSKGIGDIRSIVGYPGDLLPTRQMHLIIIVGYEYDRALSIISDMEPTSLSLGFGKSDSYTTEVHSINNKYYGAKEHFDEVVRDSMSFVSKDRVYEFEISCNNPEQAKTDIQSHLDQYSNVKEGKNILLFAMNNKVSTLGVSLFAFEHQDIQLCYAPALIYNYKNYSLPGEECYLFKLFGNL